MSRARRRGRTGEDFQRHFENPQLLDELLSVAGSTLRTGEVLERFRAARAEGKTTAEVIPTVLPPEPRFPDTEIARRLFQNLLGLWDAAAVPGFQPGSRTPRPTRPVPPGRTGPAGLDAAYLRRFQAWLAHDARGRQRLTHSFENRQDALLGSLDERGLSDEGWGVLRHLAFELYAVLELADGAAPAAVQPEALAGDPSTDVPAALVGFVDEALASAERDRAGPVPDAERETVRALARQVLAALWRARARR